MEKIKYMVVSFLCLFCTASVAEPKEIPKYAIQNANVIKFIDDYSKEGVYTKKELENIFSKTILKEKKITKRQSNQAEKKLTWEDYKRRVVTLVRINTGKIFLYKNKKILEDIEREYQVDKEVIVAILGVETNYGLNKGDFRAIDALSTLSFEYYPRSDFFRKELKEFLKYTKKNNISPFDTKSSWAGAIGYSQFIPSSLNYYGVDYDLDGKVDLVKSLPDAMASIANYLKKNGFKKENYYFDKIDVDNKHIEGGLKLTLNCNNTSFIVDSKYCNSNFKIFNLDSDTYIGGKNFYSITMYNRSNLYAAAVLEIATSLKN